MSDAEWPAPEPAAPRDPERRPAPLPRLEDLPVAEQGYDREKVREAFDAFYRHAAQLDATLSTLEAVEVFQRTSAELRAELRAIRGSGWTVGSWQGGGGGYGGRQRVSEWSLPPAFPRVAGEAIFLIVMGVIVGVAGWSRLTIVLVMALSLAVVWLIEWVAARERAIPQATAAPVVPDLDEVPAEEAAAEAEAEAEAWAPAEEGPEAMTMLGAPPVRVDEEDAEAADDAEPQAEVEEVEAEALVEPEATVEPEVEEEPEVLEDLPAEEDPAEPVLEETAAEPPAPVAEAEPGVEEPEPEVEEVEEVEPGPEDEPQPDLLAEPLPEPEPVIVVLEDENAKRGRGFFSFFRRKEEFMPVVTIAAAEPGLEPVPLESEEQVAAAEEVEGEVLDGAQALEELDVPEPGEPEPALDPWEAPPVVPEEPLVEELEPEPVAELEPEVEPEPESEPEPEPLVAELEPEPDPDVLPEPEPVDQGPLPIDVLAEQAAAALERSRARRRHLRRARRR